METKPDRALRLSRAAEKPPLPTLDPTQEKFNSRSVAPTHLFGDHGGLARESDTSTDGSKIWEDPMIDLATSQRSIQMANVGKLPS